MSGEPPAKMAKPETAAEDSVTESTHQALVSNASRLSSSCVHICTRLLQPEPIEVRDRSIMVNTARRRVLAQHTVPPREWGSVRVCVTLSEPIS